MIRFQVQEPGPTSCSFVFPFIRDLQVEPVLPLMVVSFTTTHSSSGTSNGFRSSFSCLPSPALLPFKSSNKVIKTEVFLRERVGCCHYHKPNTRWPLKLLMLPQDPQDYTCLFTQPHEGQTDFFFIILIKYISVITNCLEKRWSFI